MRCCANINSEMKKAFLQMLEYADSNRVKTGVMARIKREKSEVDTSAKAERSKPKRLWAYTPETP